jgi:hypothetical protein
MRDIEVIDSELRLLLAIHHMVREAEGRPPSTVRIDELLDESMCEPTTRYPRLFLEARPTPTTPMFSRITLTSSWIAQ